MLDKLKFNEETIKTYEEQLQKIQKILIEQLKTNANIRNMSVAPKADLEAIKRIEQTDIPTVGRDGGEVGKQLINDVFNNSMLIQHPRFFSFVASSISPYSLAGAILTDIYNPHGGAYNEAPTACIIEEKLIKWMGGLAGYPSETCGGVFVSGGSIATLSALIAARHAKLKHEDFLKGRIYFSDQTHSSVEKALRMLGFADEQIVKIPTDDDFKIRVDLLDEKIEKDIKEGMKPFALVGNLGTTNTGTIDPLDKMADIKEKYDLWFHVDGAYGGSSLISPIYRNLSKGIERSDSLTWDTHKWLMQTYSCSTLIAKDKQNLLNAFTEHPEYLTDISSSEHNDAWDMGPEMTRPHRAIKLWYTVQALGTDLLAEIIDYSFENAQIVNRILSERENWEIISKPSCGTINFRYHPQGYSEEQLDELTMKLSKEINKTEYAFIVTTTLRGKKVLRMCMINSNTTVEDVISTIELIDRIAKDLVNNKA